MQLFGVVFTNPALWIGALALAVPLIVHLLTRRSSRLLIFPTIRFIRKVQASQSAIFKLRHLLLMLVRTGFLALLLTAFLKPVLENNTLTAGDNPEAKHAVLIVLDASASMGHTGGGFSLFSRAKLATEKTLDGLRDNDLANLIVAAAVPSASFLEPTANRFHLKNDVQLARLTQERADLDAAIAEAVTQLSKTSGYKKEIHLISDFQRSNWAPVDFAKIPRDVKVVFVSASGSELDNFAITEVMLQPPAPARSEEVEVVCKVANYGRQSKLLPLQLKFGGQKTLQRDMDVPAGTTAAAGFRLRVNQTGVFEGELSIPDDALVADNRRFFTLDVSERVQVVVLSDEDRGDPGAGHRFLIRAINPNVDRGGGALTPALLTSTQFDKFAAAGAQLVIATGVREFPSAVAGNLFNYLKDGGSVIYLLSGPADRANLAALEKLAGENFKLPFRIGNLIDHGLDRDGRYASLTEANFDNPMLKAFKEARDLADIRFQKYFATEREAGQGQILMRYDDQNIALARKSVGGGSLLLGNFSPSLQHSDLAKRTIFVPFLHEMIKGMRPQSGTGRPFVVGNPVSTTIRMNSAEKDIRFSSPSGEKLNAFFELSREDAAVIFPETKESGFYRVLAGDKLLGSVAVNVDPRESNLEALSLAQVQALSEISRDRVLVASGVDLQALRGLREGKPIWHYCLLAALCLLGVEQALALVWRR
jgi:hypothetical protein